MFHRGWLLAFECGAVIARTRAVNYERNQSSIMTLSILKWQNDPTNDALRWRQTSDHSPMSSGQSAWRSRLEQSTKTCIKQHKRLRKVSYFWNVFGVSAAESWRNVSPSSCATWCSWLAINSLPIVFSLLIVVLSASSSSSASSRSFVTFAISTRWCCEQSNDNVTRASNGAGKFSAEKDWK